MAAGRSWSHAHAKATVCSAATTVTPISERISDPMPSQSATGLRAGSLGG